MLVSLQQLVYRGWNYLAWILLSWITEKHTQTFVFYQTHSHSAGRSSRKITLETIGISNHLATLCLGRRIYTEEKAKVVASVSGTEYTVCIQFHAVLVILHQDDMKKKGCTCNHPILQIVLVQYM